MKTAFFIVALLLVFIWTVGFGYHIGGAINWILVLAIILEAAGGILDLKLNKENENLS